MSEEKLIHIGTFGKPLGLRGEIKINIFTSNFKSFFSYRPLLAEDGLTEWDLDLVRISKQQAIVKLKNYNNLKSVEILRGKKIFAERKKFPKTKRNEFYYVDLINCDVVSKDKKVIGVVKNIENYGAGDLISVKSKNRKDFYLPMDKDNIISIDLQKKIIIVNPIKGLID